MQNNCAVRLEQIAHATTSRPRVYLSMPDPQTRRYRPFIKQTVKEVVQRYEEPTLALVDAAIA